MSTAPSEWLKNMGWRNWSIWTKSNLLFACWAIRLAKNGRFCDQNSRMLASSNPLSEKKCVFRAVQMAKNWVPNHLFWLAKRAAGKKIWGGAIGALEHDLKFFQNALGV